jgi:hypothetical protein
VAGLKREARLRADVPAIHLLIVSAKNDVDAQAQASGSDAVLRTATLGHDEDYFRISERVA